MTIPSHTEPVLAIFWDDGNVSHRRRRMVVKRLRRYGRIGSFAVFFRDTSTNQNKWPKRIGDVEIERITVPTIKAGDNVDDMRMGVEIISRLPNLQATAVVVVSGDKIFYGVIPVINEYGLIIIGVVDDDANPQYAKSFDFLLRIIKRKNAFSLETPHDENEFITRLLAQQLPLPHCALLSKGDCSPPL